MEGVELRDYFAVQIYAASLNAPPDDTHVLYMSEEDRLAHARFRAPEYLAEQAYAEADCLLAARESTIPKASKT